MSIVMALIIEGAALQFAFVNLLKERLRQGMVLSATWEATTYDNFARGREG